MKKMLTAIAFMISSLTAASIAYGQGGYCPVGSDYYCPSGTAGVCICEF